MKTKLFLHMGPGFHSLIEKELFSAKYPEIQFWNQPKVNSFSQLLKESENILLDLYQKANKRISIKAHSFGGQLACHLINTHPEKIDSVTLLNSSTSPFECFLNLSSDKAELKDQLRIASSEKKMEFIFNLASQPDFNDKYWLSSEKMKSYNELASQFPALDLNTFASVFTSFLETNTSDILKPKNWQGQVKIFISKNDLLLANEIDGKNWLKIFPEAQLISLKNSGHYSLFEDSLLPELFFN